MTRACSAGCNLKPRAPCVCVVQLHCRITSQLSTHQTGTHALCTGYRTHCAVGELHHAHGKRCGRNTSSRLLHTHNHQRPSIMDSQDKVPYTWIATVCTPYPNCALHTSLSRFMHGEEHDDQVELASQYLCEYSPNPHSEPHNPHGIPKKETTGTTYQAAKSDTYYDPLQVVYRTHVSFAASTIARSKPGTQRTMWGKAQRHRTPRTRAAVQPPLHTASRQTRSTGPHCTHKTTMHLTQSMCHNFVVLVTPDM
jgi:hypothetical protein